MAQPCGLQRVGKNKTKNTDFLQMEITRKGVLLGFL